MVNTVDQVYIDTFSRRLQYLAQQGISRFRPYCMEERTDGETHRWDRLGYTTAGASQKTTRNQITPINDYPWSGRLSTAKTYDDGDQTEQEDPVQMLQDPNSRLVKALGMSMMRAYDDEIITAATGDTADGDGAAIIYDTTQQVGDGTTAITYDLVTQVSELFANSDIEPETPRIMAITPLQARKLLQITEATSGDYVNVKALAEKGWVESWMGYKWITSTRLPNPDAADGDSYCFAMTEEAIGLQINKDIWSRVAENPERSFAWNVYCAATYGAIRVEDAQVVRLWLAEAL
jgi:hypothetical protein